jgi:hypothetical protein
MPCCAHSSTFEILFNKLLIRTLGAIKSSIALIIGNRMQGFAVYVSVESEHLA